MTRFRRSTLSHVTFGLFGGLAPTGLHLPLSACRLRAMRGTAAQEPSRVTRCRDRSAAAYLRAAVARVPYALPNASADCAVPGVGEREERALLEAAAAESRVVYPLVYAGEVGAEPRLEGGGAQAVAEVAQAACQSGDGWLCVAAHGLDRSDPRLRFLPAPVPAPPQAAAGAAGGSGSGSDPLLPLLVRSSRTLVKEQLHPDSVRRWGPCPAEDGGAEEGGVTACAGVGLQRRVGGGA